MIRTASLIRTTLRAAAILLAAALLAAAGRAEITFYLGVPYGNKPPSDPNYSEGLFDIFYPDGAYPALPGFENQPRPVAVLLHGGNTNTPYTGSEQVSPIGVQLLQKGFIVVIPNLHVIDLTAGESWVNATKSAARLVQFLRFFATTLNVDPNKVLVQGHSSGGFHAYYLSLHKDFQDAASPDPIEWQSSRPNAAVPWGSPSKFLCFDPNSQLVNPSWASNYFFGTPDFSTVTTQTKIAYSPVTWLLDTSLSSRPYTPVMCLVHNLTQQTPCGQVVDSHDGIFGPIMVDAIYRYCLLNPADSACAATVLLDNSDIGAVVPQVVDWMAAQVGL